MSTDSPRIVWCTSFNQAMYEASGHGLVASWACNCEGILFIGDEINNVFPRKPSRSIWSDLRKCEFLKTWLDANRDIIPRDLGGEAKRCGCRVPDDPHDKKHRKGCPGGWFNRNASRWFRKIATLHEAMRQFTSDDHVFIWIDSDCLFKAHLSNEWLLNEVFRGGACFYMRGPDRQHTALESGLIGFNGRWGRVLLDRVIEMYTSGEFRNLQRWDDGYVFQKVIKSRPDIPTCDIAGKATSRFLDVLPGTILHPYLEHNKGLHGRGLGLMT